MLAFVVRRLLWAVLLLLVVSFLTFLIFYTLPAADPAVLRAGPRAGNQALLESLRQSLGLDDPWYLQYTHYMERLVLHQDLGFSYRNDAPVRDEIVARLPATASLVLGAAVLWTVVGVGVGVLSATRPRTWMDRAAMGAALVAISAPVYWLGLVLLFLLAPDIGKVPVWLEDATGADVSAWWPFGGQGSYAGLTEDPGAWLKSLLLPWLALAATAAAFYARLVRGNLREALGRDFIRTARAKGLPERTVVWRHGMRSAMTPVVTVLGLDIGILLGGAILVETVFNIPGVGRLAYTSIRAGDLPAIEATVLLGAFFIVLANLVVDLVYAALDPRVRVR